MIVQTPNLQLLAGLGTLRNEKAIYKTIRSAAKAVDFNALRVVSSPITGPTVSNDSSVSGSLSALIFCRIAVFCFSSIDVVLTINDLSERCTVETIAFCEAIVSLTLSIVLLSIVLALTKVIR